MKTIKEIKDGYGIESGYLSWEDYIYFHAISDEDVNEIAKRYSNQFV